MTAQSLVGCMYCEDCGRGGAEAARNAKALDAEIGGIRADNDSLREKLESERMEFMAQEHALCLEVERLRALIFDESFDVRNGCTSKYHDERWCEHCESMETGVEIYQAWQQDAAGRGERVAVSAGGADRGGSGGSGGMGGG